MPPRRDVEAFAQLKTIGDDERANLAGSDRLGMLAGLGIAQGRDFVAILRLHVPGEAAIDGS